MNFRNDYRISPSASAHISCDATDCDQAATTAINNGHPPFGYFCDHHAAMMRRHGRLFVAATPNQVLPHVPSEIVTSL